jgi:hypothetical protein
MLGIDLAIGEGPMRYCAAICTPMAFVCRRILIISWRDWHVDFCFLSSDSESSS